MAGDSQCGVRLLAGGCVGGEVASGIAVRTVLTLVKDAVDREDLSLSDAVNGLSRPGILLRDAIQRANKVIYQTARTQANCEGMGTTVVAGLFFDDKLTIAHVGDSRMYRCRDGKLEQVTQDHSRLQELVSRGFYTPEEAQRAAAKNYHDVAIVTDTAQYAAIGEELRANNGALSLAHRERLEGAAYARTAAYDRAISADFAGRSGATAMPPLLDLRFERRFELRYGENPHQQAAFYRDLYPAPGSLVTAKQLHGKELSFNNIADADAAWECVKSFDAPACVIVKHALSLIHISEPTRLLSISYAVFCLPKTTQVNT